MLNQRKNVSGMKIARLMYILHTNKGLKIPEKLTGLIPGGEWIRAMSDLGPGGAGVDLSLVDKLLAEGGKLGDGNVKEGVIIMQQLVDETMREDLKMPLDRRLMIYRLLDNMTAMANGDTEIIDMSDPGEIQKLPKFDTGFTPFDVILGGFYQAIVLILAPPGTGKTSILISMMEALRNNNYPGELMYVENEIPPAMMKGRLYDVFNRTNFVKGDQMICGPWSASSILEYVKENPDPDRIIFFDSPDVMVGQTSGEGKRFYLENEFLKLIEIKRKSKLIVASSWPNRKNTQVQHQYDVSEAVAKSWYSDAIIGMNPAGGLLQLLSLKNRFGPSNTELTFDYNYVDMTWDAETITQEAEFWEAVAEANEDGSQNGAVPHD